MAIVTKTFSFSVDLESFSFTSGGKSVGTRSTTVGNPAASLDTISTGRNNADTSYWLWSGTWEDLGVPSGSTVTAIRLNGVDSKTRAWNVVDAVTIGPYQLRDSSGVSQATLWAGRNPTGLEGSWVSTGAQSDQSVPSALQSSGSTIQLYLERTIDTGNNSAASAAFNEDNISFVITYQVAAQNITPEAFDDGSVFGTAVLSVGAVSVTVIGIESSEAFGTAQINLTVAPSGIPSSELFGTADIQATNPGQTLVPDSIPSLEAFGTANLQPGSVVVNLGGVDSAESFGAQLVVPQAVPVSVNGIPSQEAHGSATLVQSGYDVYEGRGRFQVATSGSGVRATANAIDKFNVEASLNFQFGDTNSEALFRAYIRSSGDWVNNDTPTRAYELVVSNTGGFVVNRIDAGTRTVIGTGSWTASTAIQYVRFATVNNVVQVKIWETIEPEWQLTVDDSLGGLAESGTLQLGLFSVAGAHVLYVDDVLYDYASLENNVLPQPIDTGEAFGVLAVVPQAVNLTITGIGSAEAFGNSKLNLSVVSGGVSSGEVFGSTQILPGSVAVNPTGIFSQESIGTASVSTGASVVQVEGIPSGELFGTSQVVPEGIIIQISSIPSVEEFGAVAVQPGSVQISIAGTGSQEALGNPTLTVGATTVSPAGVQTGESFGETVVIAGGSGVYVPGIPTSESFGVPVLTVGQVSVAPQGINSAETFGTATLTIYVLPAQVPTTDGVGAPSILAVVNVQGIQSQEAVGSQQVLPGQVVIGVPGIESQEGVGTPALVVGAKVVDVAGIAGSEQFGQAILHTVTTTEPAGILSDELFGTPTVVPGAVVLGVVAIGSQEALGTPEVLKNMQIVGAPGIGSVIEFGIPIVTMDWGEVIHLVLAIQQAVSGTLEIRNVVSGIVTIQTKDTDVISLGSVTETIVVIGKLESTLKI